MVFASHDARAQSAAGHLLASSEQQIGRKRNLLRAIGECRLTDKARAQFRELALAEFRFFPVKEIGAHELQHGVPQKFQSFVGTQMTAVRLIRK